LAYIDGSREVHETEPPRKVKEIGLSLRTSTRMSSPEM
jgi:hypothetical protein